MTWRDRYPFRQSPRDLARLVLGLLFLAGYAALIATQPEDVRPRTTALRTSIVLGGLAALAVVGYAGSEWWESRRLGGLVQRRLYRRAVRRDGALPEDADWPRWYPVLEARQGAARSNAGRNASMFFTAYILVGIARLLGLHSWAIWLVLVAGWVLGAWLGTVGPPGTRRRTANVERLLKQIEQVAREERQRHSS